MRGQHVFIYNDPIPVQLNIQFIQSYLGDIRFTAYAH